MPNEEVTITVAVPGCCSADAMDAESAVRSRYSSAARSTEVALCCSVSYDQKFLEVLPAEIVERDYGCGDPTPFVRPGDTVLDLGSGGGKVCYVAAQIVGDRGRVIGVDCNLEMLSLARRHQAAIAEKLGFANTEFRCGLIQDLALDLDHLADQLARRPVQDQQSWLDLRAIEARLRREQPMIADNSIDCVLSNCVLNLVRQGDRAQLFAEIHRVLKPSGRAAISDIVASEDVPESLQRDPDLWSGCVSGAFREDRFVEAFRSVGFDHVDIVHRQAEPWQTVDGIVFRSITVLAHKRRPAGFSLPIHETRCGTTNCC